jgi:hypothetical protein
LSNIFGNPTLVSDKAREGAVLAYNTTLTSAPSVANPIVRVRRDAVTLVDFLLDPTTPLTGATVDGSAALAYVSPTAVAVGGTASIPNNYQILGRDAAVHLSGLITATDGISTGQTIAADTITLIAPAS